MNIKLDHLKSSSNNSLWLLVQIVLSTMVVALLTGYEFEILAIEVSGNSTISPGEFVIE